MTAVRPLLRIARRDATRARGRSTLIALMIALPVFALTMVDVLARTAQPDPDEAVTYRLGSTEYVLTAAAPIGSGYLQAPDPIQGTFTGADPERIEFADPPSLLPAGGRVLAEREAGVEIRTRSGIGEVRWFEVDAADRAFEGRYAVLSGRAPRSRAEVLVTPELLERAGARLGDVLTVTQPAAEVTVTGTARAAGTLGEQTVFAPPGTLVGRRDGIPIAAAVSRYYVDGAPPLTWEQIEQLNEQGVNAYDRTIALDPPPRSRVRYYAVAGENQSGSDRASLILALAVVVGFSLLEVVLLAGAAFMVGARRQSRSLGLLAATGGSERDVGLVVLAGGAVLGLVAAAAGVIAGTAGAAVVRPWLSDLTQTPFARFDLRPMELLAIAAVGIVAGLIAAVVPARMAARQDVVAALSGRRGQVRTGWRVPAVGLFVTATGILASFGGSLWAAAHPPDGTSTSQATVLAVFIAGGAMLAVIGLVVVSPAIIALAGRAARRLPLPARLALRDAARHRGRSAPAMSAVLAAVAGSAALVLYIASLDAHDRRTYTPALPPGNAGVGLEDYTFSGPDDNPPKIVLRDPAIVARAAERHLPVERTTVVRQVCQQETCRIPSLVVPPANQCPAQEERARAAAAEAGDWRCVEQAFGGSAGFGSSGFVVGGAEEFRRLYGVDDPRAAEVLEAGGIVTFNRAAVLDGHAGLKVLPGGAVSTGGPGAAGVDAVPERFRLPAVFARSDFGHPELAFLSRGAARRMQLEVLDAFVYFDLERLPTQDEQDAAAAAVQGTGAQDLIVERGYDSDYGLGLLALALGAAVITLGAAGIATGLAQADARADHATLAAVGANPRMRRSLAACQALVIAGLGTALGTAIGFVPAASLIGAIESLELEVPWVPLVALVVGLPLVAAAAAWAATRSKLPVDRRLEV